MRTTVRLVALAVVAGAAVTLAMLAARPAEASSRLIKGVFDESETLGRPQRAFQQLRLLRTEAVRVSLYWGGPSGVAKRRPKTATNPNDRAYNWEAYDRLVRLAARQRIKVVFSIVGTPGWANGGQRWNRAPKRSRDLRNFAYAAAKRYSGTFVTPDETRLPAVRHWLAWNEPNNPIFLYPQYRRSAQGWVIQSAIEYARICNAIQSGIRATILRREQIACGVTAPRGNNAPQQRRPSVSPLAFLRAMKRYGARGFDAYAHHPYYGRPSESPLVRPKSPTAITLGNIDTLIAELTRLYGNKRVWITEYGYQTSPPDRFFGVSYRVQARYLWRAFAFARRHPRIDMMLWFLLRDQANIGSGWQSGLLTKSGRRKRAWGAFRAVRP